MRSGQVRHGAHPEPEPVGDSEAELGAHLEAADLWGANLAGANLIPFALPAGLVTAAIGALIRNTTGHPKCWTISPATT